MKLGYLNNDDGPFVMTPKRPTWVKMHDSKLMDGRPKVWGLKLKGSPPAFNFVQ